MPVIKKILLLLLCMPVFTGFAQNKTIDSLLQIIKEAKYDIEYNKTLNVLATEYTRTDLPKAKNYLHQSIQVAKQLHNDITLSYALAQMVSVQMNTGNKDSAAYFLQQLKGMVKKDVPENVKANYNLAAGLFYKRQGNYKAALPFMINSLNDYITNDKIGPSTANKTSIAGQYLNIGNTYMDMGDYKTALQYHLKGLKIFEILENKRGISFCNQSISSDFLNMAQYDNALAYTQKSLAVKQELNDKRGMAISTAQMGSVYKGLKSYEQSLEYFSKALQSFHELKLLPDEAKTNIEIGKVYVLKKDEAKATPFF